MDAKHEIRELLGVYERALNTSDAALAAGCYTADGIFMPTTLPTAAGPEILPSYEAIFGNIRLKVSFTVDELEVASPSVAFGLTRSRGTQTVLTTGQESVESNREMFVFKRDGTGAWKISRYMFNKPE
jgi:ketosteroid isomerase-like protein